MIVGIFDGTGEVLDGASEGLERKDVRNRVRTLIGGAVDGVCRARGAFIIGDRSPGF